LENKKNKMQVISIKPDDNEEKDDKYGLIETLNKVSEYARCPKCASFLNKGKPGKLVCSNCGFEKSDIQPSD
tara:strand:- start:10965 stop:11180 length:216 start_codon:yes stop_codon:yes gene_type:complete